jgi:hypothetical protein
MLPLLFSTIITCSDALSILNKVTSIVGLTSKQKIEIVSELRKLIPSCPIVIKKDESTKK